MSRKLVARSPDLKRLRDEGYDLEVRGTHVLIKSVPYVTSAKVVRLDGVLIATLDLLQDRTKQPERHTAWFSGELPCDQHGAKLTDIIIDENNVPLAGLTVACQFSHKPQRGQPYPDYHAKMTAYVRILLHEAQAIDPTVKAKVFKPIPADPDDDSPFQYFDSASSRAGIDELSRRLAMDRIAIVGLGGTGSYVLDLVAKTYVKEIHLYDSDDFGQHNAFRCPGAVAFEDLKADLKKVDHYASVYSRLHKGIVPHPYRIGPHNAHELAGMQFVFLCMDSGEWKDAIMRVLEQAGISFIDVGMGVLYRSESLIANLRVTSSTPNKRNHIRENERISFAPATGENLYSQNIQVADLNSLNAALAVVKWKKLYGFYHDYRREHHSTYVVEMNKLSSEDT
ncbi:MAG: ThiF family adenylyltransferase [Proteobacteria bacterium]|nr:ThiF family adenylyltransferase [Pseudomonadota bacterium]